MPAYIVDYDLMNPGQKYPQLSKAIEDNYGTYWHMLQSTRVVHTPGSAQGA
jgi:hypothetical protein